MEVSESPTAAMEGLHTPTHENSGFGLDSACGTFCIIVGWVKSVWGHNGKILLGTLEITR